MGTRNAMNSVGRILGLRSQDLCKYDNLILRYTVGRGFRAMQAIQVFVGPGLR